MTTSVFVSGATGFIAQHIIKLLLSKGYTVVGSVRTAAKGEHLKQLFATSAFSYEIVPHLEQPGAFDEALKAHPEVTVFLHTASPVSFTVENVEDELLKPAKEGTLNALKAIQTHGPQIRNVVITSSVAAQVHPTQFVSPEAKISEDSWSSISWEEAKENAFYGYFGSKKFAEKAAWDFYQSEKPNYKLNIVNPVVVVGPVAYDSEVEGPSNFAAGLIQGILDLGPDSDIPDTKGNFIDVRDVAKAHLAAFEHGWENKRLLMSAEDFNSQSVLDIVNDNFEKYKGKLPVGKSGESIEVAKIENSRTRDALGFPLIDFRTSVTDLVSQLLRVGASA